MNDNLNSDNMPAINNFKVAAITNVRLPKTNELEMPYVLVKWSRYPGQDTYEPIETMIALDYNGPVWLAARQDKDLVSKAHNLSANHSNKKYKAMLSLFQPDPVNRKRKAVHQIGPDPKRIKGTTKGSWWSSMCSIQ